MKKVLLCLLFIAMPSFGFIYGNDQKIVNIVLWDGAETGPLYFSMSNGNWCYIPAGQKVLQTMVFMLYASGKTAEIHCYDTEETLYGGVPPAHKLHRIYAK